MCLGEEDIDTVFLLCGALVTQSEFLGVVELDVDVGVGVVFVFLVPMPGPSIGWERFERR